MKVNELDEPARGELTRTVERLLMDGSLGYAEIVAAVSAEFCHARTSTRSVASVAAAMRRKGVDVPMRRSGIPFQSAAFPAEASASVRPSATLYLVPAQLGIDQAKYIRWLRRKAAAHVKRDRKRCDYDIGHSAYIKLIHAAVVRQGEFDFYTGERLNWSLISTYTNDESAEGRTRYKATFAMMPTVDHVSGEDGRYDFAICSWRVNDAKSDLSHDDFVGLCRKVVAKADAHGNSSLPD